MKTLLAAMGISFVSASAVAQEVDLPRPDKTNFIEIFTESNELDCVELNFDGIALHGIARFSGVTFYVSPILSHYNPDFVVTAYPRLGDSPLLESYAALGAAQNIISEPIVELLSGTDAPNTYSTRREWGGSKGSDGGDTYNKTLAYYEAEVFGHPGNVFTWAGRAFRGETVFDPNAARALVTAIPSDAARIPSRINSSINDIAANAGTTLGSHFSLDALERIDPVELATNAFVGELTDLINSTGIVQGINRARDLIPDNIEEDIVGSIVNLAGSSFQTVGSETSAANEGRETPDPDVEIGTEFSLQGLGDDVRETIQEELAQLTPDAIRGRISEEIAGLTDQIAQVTDLFETLRSVASAGDLAALVPGVSARVLPFNGMCPSDVDPFYPYYLSGTNILSWRYKVPEIIYPQTYIPFSNSTTIGTLFPGGSDNPLADNPLSSLAEIQNYGSVYPRNGYSLQAHPVKAAAVAAFRAAHVVTRPGQPHIYRHPAPRGHRQFYQLDPGYNNNFESETGRESENTYLSPDVDETGRWQLVHNPGGEEDNKCNRFGAPQTNEKLTTDNPVKLIGEVANTFTDQWADDKKSDDNSYVFTLWRRYRCAQEERSNGTFTRNFHIYNIQFPSPVKILHNNEL